MGDCRYCGRPAGFLRRTHRACRDAYKKGRHQITVMAAKAAGQPDFNEAALMDDIATIARDSFIGEVDVRAAIANGWHQAVQESLVDGVITRAEETRLRVFRERLALKAEEVGGAATQLREAVRDRLTNDARWAALTLDGGTRLDQFAAALADSPVSSDERRALAVQGWETAVASAIEDGVLSLDEEHALVRYLHHFDLSPQDVNANGAHYSMIQSAVIREVAEGFIPDRLGPVDVPFNLMKSEQLVWLIADVDYLEIRVRRERRGTSHGLSIRIAKGVYYRPGVFRSKPIEWEETVHADTGLLGITSKHIYFHGSRKRFRIRYDRIVSFDPYDDGIGIMRDAQTAKPQTFRTGDGWFIYNLVTNLARR